MLSNFIDSIKLNRLTYSHSNIFQYLYVFIMLILFIFLSNFTHSYLYSYNINLWNYLFIAFLITTQSVVLTFIINRYISRVCLFNTTTSTYSSDIAIYTTPTLFLYSLIYYPIIKLSLSFIFVSQSSILFLNSSISCYIITINSSIKHSLVYTGVFIFELIITIGLESIIHL